MFLSSDSWEGQGGIRLTLPLFILEAVSAAVLGGLLLKWSFNFDAGTTAARAAREKLMERVATSQSLLETAMPRSVARALLGGTPAFELTEDFDTACICFISLVDFERVAAKVGPEALLAWLNRIYGSFDALVDAYPATVCKIECGERDLAAHAPCATHTNAPLPPPPLYSL